MPNSASRRPPQLEGAQLKEKGSNSKGAQLKRGEICPTQPQDVPRLEGAQLKENGSNSEGAQLKRGEI